MSSHTLYRMWSHDGTLLYVGITLRPPRRISEHRGSKQWWDDVATITFDRYPDRRSALSAEAAAIASEHPRWNIAGADDKFPHTSARLAREFAEVWTSADMPNVCFDCLAPKSPTYPHTWSEGMAYYTCLEGHHWWCEYAHGQTGRAS